MLKDRRNVFRVLSAAVVVIVLSAAFLQRASHNLSRIDYRNSNFVFFWLAGRMVLDGGNPYDSASWLAAHDTHGITWRPNRIFPYPLPLALLVAPLGLTSLDRAYFLWQLVSEVLVALVVWTLLVRSAASDSNWRLFGPLMLILLFFGPLFISLQIGALGALTLSAVLITIVALEAGYPALAGLSASLLLLKPPQGLPLLLLVGVWLIVRRQWKAIAGVAAGSGLLLLAGIIIDPQWLSKFITAGEAVIDRTMGVQSNTFGLAYHACGGEAACMWWVGGLASSVILGAVCVHLARRAGALRAWDVLTLSIPVAYVVTVYMWSYDQILYLVPLIWILRRLIESRRSYLPAAIYLATVMLFAFAAMVVQAYTRSDLLSLATTILVLTAVLVLQRLSAAGSAASHRPTTSRQV